MSIIQIVDEQLGKIASPNRFYNYNRSNWKFLLVSYMGGEDYKRYQLLTRYALETDSEYTQRLEQTPLHNHCKSVINVYNSFLFQHEPDRYLGDLTNLPETQDFLEDADFDGKDLNSFMKDVSTWASVFGHCWILVSKANVGAITKADEQAVGVRPYVSILSPLSVIDWTWTRDAVGRYQLSYVKYIEDINGNVQTIKEWTAEAITTHTIDYETRTTLEVTVEPNGLGEIPMVLCYHQKSPVRGFGVSAIQDIAKVQQFIYNQVSEAEQAIRLDNHPSLVKTNETQASAGAGSIIAMPENLEPGLKPYLLETSGAQISSIYEAIKDAVDSIDLMANTGSVRATSAKLLSGVAMTVEFQLLNAKLAEMADNLELAEETIWSLFAKYQGQTWAGEIKYEDAYGINDKEAEYTKLQVAKSAATSPEVFAVIDRRIIELLEEDELPDDADSGTAEDMAEDSTPVREPVLPDAEPIAVQPSEVEEMKEDQLS